MGEPRWKVRGRWTLPDGSEEHGLIFLAETETTARHQALRAALAYFLGGTGGPIAPASITLEIEEVESCGPSTSG